MKGTKRTIIVGAGVAGLTLAYQLALAGQDVLLVEKESVVGGLARSFSYDDFIFDIGPHRFHTDDPEVVRFIREVLGDDYTLVERKSGVWMFGTYFDWPLNARALLAMPLPVIVSVGRDLLRRRGAAGEDFKTYIINRYGKTLYELFFRPYTEKFLGIPCAGIAKDWAVTGIERAVIDKKIRVDDLAGLARSLLFPKPPLKFIYPRKGGIGTFCEILRRKIESHGGSIALSSRVEKIEVQERQIKRVFISGNAFACDVLVWTGPLSEILALLKHDRSDLEYLSLLLYNYRVNHAPRLRYQWCYYGAQDIPFNRASLPARFNPLLAPPGKAGICVEVTSRQGEAAWKKPEALEPAIRTSLKLTGLVEDENDILDVHIEKIPHAYPIYASDYAQKLQAAGAMVNHYDTIRLLGRTGTFWYNNMDHSIRAALDLSRTMLDQEKNRKV